MGNSGPAAPAVGKTAAATEISDSSRNTWASLEPSLALLSSNTRKAYVSTIEGFRRWMRGREPTPGTARSFFLDLVNQGLQDKSRGLKATSLARHRAALRWLFREVLDTELPRLPKVKQEEREPRHLTLDQVQALLGACRTPLEAAVVHTLYAAGLRVSELLSLRREDIDDAGYLLIQGKGGREERVPVPELVIRSLAAYVRGKRRQEVFPFGYASLRGVLNAVADRANVQRFTPHALRHSYVTHSLMAGAAVQDVSKAVRHRNIQTTMRYVHISDHDLKSRLPDLLKKQK